jgi:DNA-binding transcriptional ArsR family regulator
MTAEYKLLHFPPEAVHVDPKLVARLPESARRVFDAVRENGPITHDSLRAATGMPARTIRFAVKRLRERGYIESMRSLKDCRTCYFFVSRDLIQQDALDAARRQADEAMRAGRLVERVERTDQVPGFAASA